MIEPISKISFSAKPKIEPVEPVKRPGPLDNNSGLSMTSPLQTDVFQKAPVPPVAAVPARKAYEDTVSHVAEIGRTTTEATKNTSVAFQAAQRGDASAQRQLDVKI